MKRFMIIPFIVLLAFILSTNSSAQDKKMDMKKKVETTETKVMDTKLDIQKNSKESGDEVVSTKPVNSVCPVSGEEVDSKVTAVYKDKTYAFCCKNCLKKFNKDPEKYISKLSEDGKSLKKNKQQ
ncbi:MAG TPA: YHS domain-containing protein [Ignavibacteriaceae bacterium]